MYKTRKTKYRRQIHQEDDEEDEASVQSRQTKARKGIRGERFTEEVANTPIYTKAQYTKELGSNAIEKMPWKRFPDPVKKLMRKILSDQYRKILEQTADNPDHIKREMAYVLTEVAKHVDNSLKNHLIPGTFDTNLLNINLPEAVEEAKKKYNEIAIQTAKEELALEHKKRLMDIEREKADKSKEIEERKRILSQYSIQEDPESKPMDYVQSLMRYPSSGLFDSF